MKKMRKLAERGSKRIEVSPICGPKFT